MPVILSKVPLFLRTWPLEMGKKNWYSRKHTNASNTFNSVHVWVCLLQYVTILYCVKYAARLVNILWLVCQVNKHFAAMFVFLLNSVSHVWETGVLDRLTRKWFPEKSDCYGDETKAVPVSLDLLPTAFIIAAGGVGVAGILLALERLMSSGFHTIV